MKSIINVFVISIVLVLGLMISGCGPSVKADAIDNANVAMSQAMAAKYSQTIQACKFVALPGQSIELKGVSEFSCNYEAKPLAYIQKQHIASNGEKALNTLMGIAQIAAPIVGQAVNTKYLFKGLTDLTGIMATGFGHNSSVITNTTGSYNSDRHDSATTITGSSFDSSIGDNRNNQPVTTDSHDVDSHAVDDHTVTPAPVVVTPVVTGP